MQRHTFEHDDLTFSFLDDGAPGQPLLALHAHWMEASTYCPLAAALAPDWRVIALDQRGHGQTDHAERYDRSDYLGDMEALLDHLQCPKAAVLGNSLGGVNAYQFAARRPQRVTTLVVEEIGAVVDDDVSFIREWQGLFPSREALNAKLGRMAPYLQESIRETADGRWRTAFNPEDMIKSQDALNGDHWSDWCASKCPTLLLRGRDSPVTRQAEFDEMATVRPNTALRTLPGGHVLHADNPAQFSAEVGGFLDTI